MKKLKLNLDQIRVASFETETVDVGKGTIKGNAGGITTVGAGLSGSFDGCESCDPLDPCQPQFAPLESTCC